MFKKLSCVSCGSLKRFPQTFTTGGGSSWGVLDVATLTVHPLCMYIEKMPEIEQLCLIYTYICYCVYTFALCYQRINDSYMSFHGCSVNAPGSIAIRHQKWDSLLEKLYIPCTINTQMKSSTFAV